MSGGVGTAGRKLALLLGAAADPHTVPFGLHVVDIRGADATGFVLLVAFVVVPITIAALVLLAVRFGGIPAATGVARRTPTLNPEEA